MNPHDQNEDAEFEDFLNGEGDLARRLQGMAQPWVPEAISAAILARAAADARGAQPGVPANDAVHDVAPATPPARHYLRRARIPLGLAASVVLALFVVRGLAPQAEREVVMRDKARPEPMIVAVAPDTPVPAAAPPAREELAPPVPVRSMKTAPRKRPAPTADVAIAAATNAVVPEAEMVIAAAPAAPPPPPALVASFASVASQAPAPATVFARSAAPIALPPIPLSAPVWLIRIDDMLKTGKTKEAHAEWLKFRMRYPDADVPLELRRQLEAIN